jgi:hypothetical protein
MAIRTHAESVAFYDSCNNELLQTNKIFDDLISMSVSVRAVAAKLNIVYEPNFVLVSIFDDKLPVIPCLGYLSSV